MRRLWLWGAPALTAGLFCLYVVSQLTNRTSLVEEGIFTPGVQVTMVPQEVDSATQQAPVQSLAEVATGSYGAGPNGM
jgi:hypothetical protein